MTQRAYDFKAGDRVHLLSPIAGVAAGTVGTVMYRFLGASLYDVRFDGQHLMRLVEERKLAPIPAEQRQHFLASD
jgi:hypothetical protein